MMTIFLADHFQLLLLTSLFVVWEKIQTFVHQIHVRGKIEEQYCCFNTGISCWLAHPLIDYSGYLLWTHKEEKTR